DLAPPQSQPNLAIRDGVARAKSGPERLLQLVDIFAVLTPDERATIASRLTQRSYDEGETLVKPGMVLGSLFIVGSGVLSLTRDESEGELEVMRLGPGDHFGEVGLLTGAASSGKITAMLPATVYELAKADLTPLLEARPQVAHELCRALARRQAAGRLVTQPD